MITNQYKDPVIKQPDAMETKRVFFVAHLSVQRCFHFFSCSSLHLATSLFVQIIRNQKTAHGFSRGIFHEMFVKGLVSDFFQTFANPKASKHLVFGGMTPNASNGK